MLRRNQLIATAALVLGCFLPAFTAVAQQDLRSADAHDAAAASERRDHQGSPGVYTDREREINRRFQQTPEYKRMVLQTRLERLEREVATATDVPSSGFDWGDAGIGAAGMLALFSIAAGSTLLMTNRMRRRSFQVAAH